MATLLGWNRCAPVPGLILRLFETAAITSDSDPFSHTTQSVARRSVYLSSSFAADEVQRYGGGQMRLEDEVAVRLLSESKLV